MRAIIETGRTQVAVEPDAKLKVPALDVEVGKEVNFDKVLLISDAGETIIGRPYVEGGMVTAEVVGHGKDDKVRVFKFKRRTKYRKMRGHRTAYTEILVKKITH